MEIRTNIKNSFYTLLFMSIVLFMNCTLLAYARNLPKDFKGIQPGTHVTSLKEMTLIGHNSSEITVYERKNDELIWNDIKLNRIRYFFYNDKFESVELQLTNTDSKIISKIKQKLIASFGDPNPLSGKKRLSWIPGVVMASYEPFAYFVHHENENIAIIKLGWLSSRDPPH